MTVRTPTHNLASKWSRPRMFMGTEHRELGVRCLCGEEFYRVVDSRAVVSVPEMIRYEQDRLLHQLADHVIKREWRSA